MAAAGAPNFNYGFPTPGPQTPTSTQVMDHVYFLSNAAWKRARESTDYDLIIIGTGPCGLSVAHRALQNNPHTRLLMIERGPFFLPEHFQNLPPAFTNTLGGLSETFPWTLARSTATGADGPVTWQHGMVPFFGGRSTLWSAWCPRPTDAEMTGWPAETIDAAKRYFAAAEEMLCVQSADEVDGARRGTRRFAPEMIAKIRPVYGALQLKVQNLLATGKCAVPTVYRTEPAPLASRGVDKDGIDFVKYATPGPLLELIQHQRQLQEDGKGATLDVVTGCVVQRILEQQGVATALHTSRGVLPVGEAKVVLAMGTLPPTTLVQQSFPMLRNIGTTFSAHFITSVIARVPKKDLDPDGSFGELEVAACYVAGVADENYGKQFHIQLTALSDRFPEKNAGIALRYMPDVVATASALQLKTSKDYVVFVCAVLGELGTIDLSTFLPDGGSDPNTASLLQLVSSDETSMETWDAMDKATFETLEKVLSPEGAAAVEYWHGEPDKGEWKTDRPGVNARRVPATVHESTTLPIGNDDEKYPVNLQYRLVGTENVYVTGGGLWPRGGSWNPTMTMVGLSMHLADLLVPQKGKKGNHTCA